MTGRGGRKRGRRARALTDRLQTALLVLVLVGVGALLGSFWLEWRHEASPGAAADRPRGESPLEGRPRVEVLNGVGEAGAAREVAEYLRGRGFDVVYFGNAAHFGHAVTRVLDRSGRPAAAGRVARVMGRDSAPAAPEPELYLDATVILGSDWREAVAAGARSAADP